MVTINLLTPRKLTVKATLAAIRALGLSVRYNSDYREYRVTLPMTNTEVADPKRSIMLANQERFAYYTNDSYDALATARHMAERLVGR